MSLHPLLLRNLLYSALKKGKVDSSISFDLEYIQRFWSVSGKKKFLSFKDRLFAHGRVICLEHLEDSHCSVSHLFFFQSLDNLFLRCANEAIKDPIRMFYANLRISKDNGDPETLILGTRIVLSKNLFEKVFDTRFSKTYPFSLVLGLMILRLLLMRQSSLSPKMTQISLILVWLLSVLKIALLLILSPLPCSLAKVL